MKLQNIPVLCLLFYATEGYTAPNDTLRLSLQQLIAAAQSNSRQLKLSHKYGLLPQALFVVGLARNAIGSAITGSAIGDAAHHKVADYLNKLASKTDAAQTGLMASFICNRYYWQGKIFLVA